MNFLCGYHETIKIELNFYYFHLFQFTKILALHQQLQQFAQYEILAVYQVGKVTNKARLQECHLNMVQ